LYYIFCKHFPKDIFHPRILVSKLNYLIDNHLCKNCNYYHQCISDSLKNTICKYLLRHNIHFNNWIDIMFLITVILLSMLSILFRLSISHMNSCKPSIFHCLQRNLSRNPLHNSLMNSTNIHLRIQSILLDQNNVNSNCCKLCNFHYWHSN